MKLDAKTIAGLMLPDDEVDRIFFDEELPGFGYRLRKCGNRLQRSWVAQYRAHGRTRRSTIGQAGKLTPGQARDAARKLLATVELGGDPQGDKAAKRQQEARTLRSVVALYLEEKKPALRPSSFRVTQLYLTGDYFRPLHHVGVSAITHPDVAGRISAIKHNSGTVTARQARAALGPSWIWMPALGCYRQLVARIIVRTGLRCQRQHWQSSKQCRSEATATICSAIAPTMASRPLPTASRSLTSASERPSRRGGCTIFAEPWRRGWPTSECSHIKRY
jgi:hypothetical protein